MSLEDFRINAHVRRILERSGVDTEALRFGSIDCTVYFHGRFEAVEPDRPRGRGSWEEGAPSTAVASLARLEALEREVRREPGVRDVVFRIDNFRRTGGKWEPTGP
jgi:hypothetical protein